MSVFSTIKALNVLQVSFCGQPRNLVLVEEWRRYTERIWVLLEVRKECSDGVLDVLVAVMSSVGTRLIRRINAIAVNALSFTGRTDVR